MLTVILRTDNTKVSFLEQGHTATAVLLVLIIAYVMLLCAGGITRMITASAAPMCLSASWA